jgi:protein-L-isoaspartate(D-aspartate) O-methyltransferase
MTPDPSGTTSTEQRAEMVERQLRGRGIGDERVLAAMAEVPRERFLPKDVQKYAYADAALPIAEGQTMSQPWIVAFMAQLLELRGDESVLEVGTGSGYAAAVLSRLCREVVTIERHERLANTARQILGELGYDNVEVRVGDGRIGAPDRAPFGGISVTATAQDEPPPALLDPLAPHAALVIPVRRRRRGTRRGVRAGALRAAGGGRVIREFSAGGLVVRNFRGRPFVAAVQVKDGTVLALPKGRIEPGEHAAETAAREVEEETGLRADLVEKLGDVKYWYVRKWEDGERVFKVVSFFLFRYRSGSLRDFQRSEVDGAEWVPLEDAPRLLAYRGEKDMAKLALSKLAESG